MRLKSIKESSERVFVLILDQGEEAFKETTDLANQERIDGASVRAIGAFSEAKVGWFRHGREEVQPIAVNEMRVPSLIGDIAKDGDGNASLHLHTLLGLQDGSLRGGHYPVRFG